MDYISNITNRTISYIRQIVSAFKYPYFYENGLGYYNDNKLENGEYDNESEIVYDYNHCSSNDNSPPVILNYVPNMMMTPMRVDHDSYDLYDSIQFIR